MKESNYAKLSRARRSLTNQIIVGSNAEMLSR